MNHLERVQAVLRGELPDRIPVIPQNFMFSAMTAGYQIGEINRSPRKMAESHRICQEKYGYDGCVLDVDDAALAEACGAKVHWRKNNVAAVDEHEPVLKDLRDIDSLHFPDPFNDGRLPEWLETTSRLKDMIGKDVFIMGRADQGPFSLLCLLRGAQNFMMDLMDEDPEVIHHALEWTTKAHLDFAKAQLSVGAHATSMGDAYASPNLIGPEMYEAFAFAYEKKTAEAILAENQVYSIHICGDTNKIIGKMGETAARILEVDWKVDLKRAREILPENCVLMGNINPSDPLVLGTPEQVKEKAKKIIGDVCGKGLILSSGCAIGANTKPENFAAMVESAKLYGTKEQLLELQNKR